MGKLNLNKRIFAVILLCATAALASSTLTFTTLHSFHYTDGANPFATLVLATDGNFYGTTTNGGPNGDGTVFKITPNGMLTTLYNFCSQSGCTDGFNAFAGLVQATDGNFYGTTSNGGANGDGTVFKITPTGMLTTLHSFDGTDGFVPVAALVQATDGNFYGTTAGGGANSNGGVVFQITPSGTLTTLYSFCSQTNCADGTDPVAALVQATDGNFYGTTLFGGANGDGTVFKITPTGMLFTLYSFCSQTNCTDGEIPYAALVQATDGNLYGTTSSGGANGRGEVFKITPAGMLTKLYSFCSQSNCTDGATPTAALVQATNGNFYGTTRSFGGTGAGAGGTVFQITPCGTLTTLYNFCSQSGCADGTDPGDAALVQFTPRKFYGITYGGGANLDGTVFRLSVGVH